MFLCDCFIEKARVLAGAARRRADLLLEVEQEARRVGLGELLVDLLVLEDAPGEVVHHRRDGGLAAEPLVEGLLRRHLLRRRLRRERGGEQQGRGEAFDFQHDSLFSFVYLVGVHAPAPEGRGDYSVAA